VSEQRRGGRSEARVRLASAIEPDWLLDLFPDAVEDRLEVEWNPKARRVEAFSRMRFGQVVLAESREAAAGRPEATALLAEQARRLGLATFADPDHLHNLANRFRVARAAAPDAGYPDLDEATVDAAVARMCEGRSSLDELKGADLIQTLLDGLSWEARAALEKLAPTAIPLPGRKRAPVAYPDDAPPFVASRLQDFFGLTETPRIGGGRVPLQVRLLAPNGRPVQITQDLEGFWVRHYPEIRRELSRRYPKHAWPEDPHGR
jgi:ATP-dependent helicase HrpB